MRESLLFLGLVTSMTLFAVPLLGDDKDKASNKTPDIVYVAEDDKEMNAAMEKARKSVDELIKVFKNRKKGQRQFGVKVAIRDGKKVEHFWVQISKFDGKQFVGEIANDPMVVKTVKEGDEIKVAKDKISDWMYVDKDKLVGGYTVRVLRKRLSPEERKALDDSLDYKIE